MGVRLVSSVEGSPITQAHFSSVACGQEVDFVMCDLLWCRRASMERTVEQRYTMKFCFKLGKSALEIFELIKQAYGDAALSRTRVLEWHKMYFEDY